MNSRSILIVLLLSSTLLWAVPTTVWTSIAGDHQPTSSDSIPLNGQPAGEKETEDCEVELDELKARVDTSLGFASAVDPDEHWIPADQLSIVISIAHDGSRALSRPPPADNA